MFDDAAREFLSRPLFARLATNGADGYPHTVPIWFELDVSSDPPTVVFISDRTARKVKNALRDARAAVVIGGEPTDDHTYFIRGDINVEEDPDHAVTHRLIDRYEQSPRREELRDEWKNDDIVVLRMRPISTIDLTV